MVTTTITTINGKILVNDVLSRYSALNIGNKVKEKYRCDSPFTMMTKVKYLLFFYSESLQLRKVLQYISYTSSPS